MPVTLYFRYICDGGNRLQTSRAELEQHYEELINAMDIVGFADDVSTCNQNICIKRYFIEYK